MMPKYFSEAHREVELATILTLYPMSHKFLAIVMPGQIIENIFLAT
jgi:hypothetical protein